MRNLSIRPLNTGFVSPPKTLFYHYTLYGIYDPPECQEETPVFCFLVEGGDKPLLVDTGISSTEHARKYHSPEPYQPEGMSILEQLAQIGYTPEDIGYVVLTHLHWDHCFYLQHFTNAKVFAHPKEIKFAADPNPTYNLAYEHPSIGIQSPYNGVVLEPVKEGDEIIPGVTVLDTPGHSPGHITVCISTPSGEYLCVGDAIVHMDNIKEVKELNYEISPPGRFVNLIECWNSIAMLKKRAKSPDYLLLAHDKCLVDRVKKTPILR